MAQKPTILTSDFFNKDTKQVAQALLGKVLYRQTDGLLYRAIITETEAYHGISDLACHCSKGITPRTEIMYGPPGYIYIYLIYGMYYMLNFVTMPQDFPAAVLIRGLSNLQTSQDGKHFTDIALKTDGPGKLTKHLQIRSDLNKLKIDPKNKLWVSDEGFRIAPGQIIKSKRIGVAYAQAWADKPWRFQLKSL